MSHKLLTAPSIAALSWFPAAAFQRPHTTDHPFIIQSAAPLLTLRPPAKRAVVHTVMRDRRARRRWFDCYLVHIIGDLCQSLLDLLSVLALLLKLESDKEKKRWVPPAPPAPPPATRLPPWILIIVWHVIRDICCIVVAAINRHLSGVGQDDLKRHLCFCCLVRSFSLTSPQLQIRWLWPSRLAMFPSLKPIKIV